MFDAIDEAIHIGFQGEDRKRIRFIYLCQLCVFQYIKHGKLHSADGQGIDIINGFQQHFSGFTGQSQNQMGSCEDTPLCTCSDCIGKNTSLITPVQKSGTLVMTGL